MQRQRLDARGRVRTRLHTDSTGDVSTLDELYQHSSARIRFPNDHQPGVQAVLMNTAGGLTGDDRLHWEGFAGQGSSLTMTTAACEKIYRSHGPAAQQTVDLSVGKQARLCWLPQETIVFDGASLQRNISVQCEPGSRALIAESVVFGRQAMDESIQSVLLHDRWRIYRQSRLLHAEDFRVDTTSASGTASAEACGTATRTLTKTDPVRASSRASGTTSGPALPTAKGKNAKGHSVLNKAGVMHHYRALATVVLIHDEQDEWFELICSRVREIAQIHHESCQIGVSHLPSRIVVRALGISSFHLRKFLIPCIAVLNDGEPVPKVWHV